MNGEERSRGSESRPAAGRSRDSSEATSRGAGEQPVATEAVLLQHRQRVVQARERELAGAPRARFVRSGGSGPRTPSGRTPIAVPLVGGSTRVRLIVRLVAPEPRDAIPGLTDEKPPSVHGLPPAAPRTAALTPLEDPNSCPRAPALPCSGRSRSRRSSRSSPLHLCFQDGKQQHVAAGRRRGASSADAIEGATRSAAQ